MRVINHVHIFLDDPAPVAHARSVIRISTGPDGTDISPLMSWTRNYAPGIPAKPPHVTSTSGS